MHFRTLQNESLQDNSSHSSQKQPFQDHPPQTVPVSRAHCTTADVCDIITIRKAFLKSFNQVGNMPGTYTICTDPSIPPGQHARQKVLIEYKEQIEKALQHMEDLQIIKPVTTPTELFFFHHIPKKTRWHTMHMFGSQRFERGNNQRTLQGTNTQRNLYKTGRSNHFFQTRHQGCIWEHTPRHYIFLSHHIQHT